METTHNARLSPRALYHAFWHTAWTRFYDRSRLEGWEVWEHRFDHIIRTECDAFAAIAEMLASLQDGYTLLKTPSLVQADLTARAERTSPVSFRWWNRGVAYIRIHTFDHPELALHLHAALEEMEGACGFLIDLRGNRGGLLHQANIASSLFMRRGQAMSWEWWQEGIFRKQISLVGDEGIAFDTTTRNGDVLESGIWTRFPHVTVGRPVYLLIDRSTASAAELFAGILRDNDVVVIVGSESAGKGIGQDTLIVANGCELKVTDGVFLPPSRQWFGDDAQTFRNGVHPHVEVLPDRRYNGDLVADVAYCHMLGLPDPRLPAPHAGSRAA